MTRTTCPLARRSRLGIAALGLAALTATAVPGTATAAPGTATPIGPVAVTADATVAVAGTRAAATAAERQVARLLAAAKARGTSATRPAVAAAVIGSSLPAGGTLAPGDSLRSPSGRYELVLDPGGELSLQTTANAFQPEPSFIGSIAFGPAGSRLVLQTDGNLVLYGPDNVAYFAAATTTGQRLDLQDDGNLVLYAADNAVALNFETAEPDFLDQGGTLLGGERLTGGDGSTSLVMQSDGNLVLYTAGAAVFATNTFSPGAALVFQRDGNAVVYSTSLQPLFATGSAINPSEEFALLAVLDRQFNVFGLRGFEGEGGELTSLFGSAWGTSTVENGAVLVRGDRRTAPGGRILLILQTDGNLVQYVDGRPLFRTGTRTPDLGLMQPDGNFVLYRTTLTGDDEDLTPVYQTRTDGFAGSRLVVQADANIVVYTPAGRAVFSTLR